MDLFATLLHIFRFGGLKWLQSNICSTFLFFMCRLRDMDIVLGFKPLCLRFCTWILILLFCAHQQKKQFIHGATCHNYLWVSWITWFGTYTSENFKILVCALQIILNGSLSFPDKISECVRGKNQFSGKTLFLVQWAHRLFWAIHSHEYFMPWVGMCVKACCIFVFLTPAYPPDI